MSRHRKDVPRMPGREEMPPELAAMTLPPDDEADEKPTVILNTNEEDLRGVYRDFRPAILIPVLLGLLAEKPVQVIRHHQVASAVAATAVMTTAVLASVERTMDRGHPPLVQPTSTMATITLPPTTTATHQAEPSRSRTAQPSRTEPPGGPTTRPSPTGDDRSSPERRRSTGPTREPTRSNAEPAQRRTEEPGARTTQTQDVPTRTQEAELPAASDPPPVTTATRPEPSPGPPVDEPDPSTAAPAADQRDCLIDVRVDPLLRACVG